MPPSLEAISVNKDLDTAPSSMTLPSRVYTAPDVFAKEMDRIFARTWQYVGHVEKVRNPGDYVVVEVAGESVILVRGKDGVLSAFFNVCAHRAARVASGEGCRKRFSCPYHGWTYDLAGELVGAPNAANVPDFQMPDHRLKPCRVEQMHGLVFINLDSDAKPLAESARGIKAEIREYAPNLSDLTFIHRTDPPLKCNWKVAVENYSECYHCTLVQ